MRLGVFGGTFDPIHCAHLRAAEAAAEALRLDRVVFMPAGRPPHRSRPAVSPARRLAMVRLAVAGNPRFEVSDLEIRRPGKSFTVDTLAQLARREPDARLFLLLGMDQFAALPGWHDAERLVGLCRLAVFNRPGAAQPHWPRSAGLPLARARVLPVPLAPLDISATDIRRRAARGLSLRYLVPDAVAAYILRHGLYRPAAE